MVHILLEHASRYSRAPSATEFSAVERGNIASCSVDTPVGVALLTASPAGLIKLQFDSLEAAPRLADHGARAAQDEHLRAGVAWLKRYFDGRPDARRPQMQTGGTTFQRAVWRALCGVPWGHTKSYADLAAQIGSARAFRAVGGACGANPLPLFIPCHRVVTRAGTLGGFSCGPHRKRWLLLHEDCTGGVR